MKLRGDRSVNRVTHSMQNHFDKACRFAEGYASTAYRDSMAWAKKNYHQTYQSAQHYASDAYYHSMEWITKAFRQTRVNLLQMRASIKHNTFRVLNTGKTLAWTHKKWVLSGTMIGIALWIIHYIWKNRPQYPLVELKSTADVAILSIKNPQKKHVLPNVNLMFCIDTSASMGNGKYSHAYAVKKAVNSVLTKAQQEVDKTAGANIEITLIRFDKSAEVIFPATRITPTPQGASMSGVARSIKQKLEQLKSEGDDTNILLGLERSVEEVEKMARKNPHGSHLLIFLTDGEDKNVNAKALKSIHDRLTVVQAKLFVIGIGAEHSKDTLLQIAAPQTFKGVYIDTTSGMETIQSAISKVYEQAVASFHHLELTAPQLAPGTWEVLPTPIMREEGEEKCKLGSLSEEATLVKAIKIHGHKLKSPLDLSTVRFNLTFIDPKGRRGTLALHWNPDTTLDNEVASAVEKERLKPPSIMIPSLTSG
jgi:Mg-chelatase subunit ChlD